MTRFLEALKTQRMDDHRYYHHSRINQSLHLVSAVCFLLAYGLLFTDPAAAALVGWLGAMVSRQIGHFFFEPKTYDFVNGASHEHKEAIKVGYNLRRKTVLMLVWALSPLVLMVDPTLFGWIEAPREMPEYVRRTGEIWLFVGAGGLLSRMVQLCILKDAMTALVWAAKILTDPFHDIKLYYKSPLHLLRGELIDPMASAKRR